MKIQLADHKIDLDVAKVLGSLRIAPDDARSLEDLVEAARLMVRAGAEFIDVGLKLPKGETANAEQEKVLVLPLIRAIGDENLGYVGVCTSNPETMRQANAQGASFIVDPQALSREGALETAAELGVPVIICGPDIVSEEDPVSKLQEFFYERIDACLNAGMKRQHILIDPLYGNLSRVDAALKLLGRLKTLESFALPLCVTVPSYLPYAPSPKDDGRNKGAGVMELTLGLFCADKGVKLIRTEDVSGIAMALAAWQIMSQTAKPHQLSKGIVRRMINMREAFKARRAQKREQAKKE